MTVRLLPAPPLSGEFDEVRFGTSGDFTWVLFGEDTANPWVGAFQDGEFGKTAAFSTSRQDEYFVVACGRGYFVSAERKVLSSFDEYDLRDALPLLSDGRVIANDSTDLFVLGAGGLVWTSGRVAWDGIELLSVSRDQVSGRLEPHDEPREFTVVLPQLKLLAGLRYPD